VVLLDLLTAVKSFIGDQGDEQTDERMMALLGGQGWGGDMDTFQQRIMLSRKGPWLWTMNQL
jgi:hypothetical protein